MVAKILKESDQLERASNTILIDINFYKQSPSKKIPRTIENTGELDETIYKPNDEELIPFAFLTFFSHSSSILKQNNTPKILTTTCHFSSIICRGPAFIPDLLSMNPNAHYFKRGTYDIKNIFFLNFFKACNLCLAFILNHHLWLFFLSKLLLWKDIKNRGNSTSHKLELVLNNFTMCSGHHVGSKWFVDTITFLHDPNFRGHRVVTFHN
ncbi:unnamed protein product [Coffea canephora]|uniref:Uncharacterized protein n=1 Tax=Coffea canephora TaxID=49390 RepID=A0A068UJ36_COFCA|nr:unnamed protein product [Coffea canephora]